MNKIFDLVIFLLMICYALLNGTASYCFKIGLEKVEDLEITIKGIFRNIFRTIYQLLKVPVLILAILFVVSGFLIYQYGLMNYDLSLMRTLSSLNTVVIFAWGFIMLKEQVTKREIIGIASMILGVIMVSLFVEPKSEVLIWINMINFIIFAVALCIILTLLTFIKKGKTIEEYFLSIVSGILFSLGQIFNNAIYITGGNEISLELYIYNQFSYYFAISYFFAFFIQMVAYYKGRLVIVAPIVNLLTLCIPVLGGLFIFGEEIIILFEDNIILPWSLLKIIGIILVFAGIIALYPKLKLQKIQAISKNDLNG